MIWHLDLNWFWIIVWTPAWKIPNSKAVLYFCGIYWSVRDHVHMCPVCWQDQHSTRTFLYTSMFLWTSIFWPQQEWLVQQKLTCDPGVISCYSKLCFRKSKKTCCMFFFSSYTVFTLFPPYLFWVPSSTQLYICNYWSAASNYELNCILVLEYNNKTEEKHIFIIYLTHWIPVK